MKSIQDRIIEIDARIHSLNKVYQDDMNASYKEASQTQDMISLLEKQKFELQKDLNKGANIAKGYVLKSADGEEIIFNVVPSDPNRADNEISEQSTIGKLLMNSAINDKIIFKEKEFTIQSVK